MRASKFLAVVLLMGAMVGSGCGDDGDSGDGAGADGADGAGGDGAGGDGAGGDGGGSQTRDEFGNCSSGDDGGGMVGTCTQDEIDEYAACAPAMCDAEYKACLGENYQSGTFDGPCGDYIRCVQDCPCDDTQGQCVQACGAPPSQFNAIATCVQQKCPLPACATGGGGTDGTVGGGGGTCADLEACCPTIADPNLKMACDNGVAGGQDALCGPILSGLQANGECG